MVGSVLYKGTKKKIRTKIKKSIPTLDLVSEDVF